MGLENENNQLKLKNKELQNVCAVVQDEVKEVEKNAHVEYQQKCAENEEIIQELERKYEQICLEMEIRDKEYQIKCIDSEEIIKNLKERYEQLKEKYDNVEQITQKYATLCLEKETSDKCLKEYQT